MMCFAELDCLYISVCISFNVCEFCFIWDSNCIIKVGHLEESRTVSKIMIPKKSFGKFGVNSDNY